MEVQEAISEYEIDSTTKASAVAGIARRLLDITIATLALVLLAPFLAVIALAILIDTPGPVVFSQRRLGRDMRPFTLHKFRTMLNGADSARHREYVRKLIVDDHGATADESPGLYKLTVDDRITRVGRFLRRTSLDELPQLWNVLRGEMSLVGPRPVIPYEVEHYPAWYRGRFAVQPGLTGLWQVSGRNERTYEEMMQFDVEYAQRQSLRLDLIILAKTPWVLLRRRGAA